MGEGPWFGFLNDHGEAPDLCIANSEQAKLAKLESVKNRLVSGVIPTTPSGAKLSMGGGECSIDLSDGLGGPIGVGPRARLGDNLGLRTLDKCRAPLKIESVSLFSINKVR